MDEIVKHINDTNASYRNTNAGNAKNTDLFLDNEHYEMFRNAGEQITVRFSKKNLSQAILFIASILPRKYDNSTVHEVVDYSARFVREQLNMLDGFFMEDGKPVNLKTQKWNARKDVPKKNGEIDNRFYFNGLLEEYSYFDIEGNLQRSKFTIRNYLAGGYSSIHIKKSNDNIFDITVVNTTEAYYDDSDNENNLDVLETTQILSNLPLQQIFYGAPGTGKSFGIKRALVNNNVLSYLSAIRTKPFLLLAGISGTGKSRIVKEMAYASCPDEGDLRKDKTSPGNYCLVEVKPNWNDSTELLGYETVLDGGNYHLTKFVKFLIKAMQHENVPFFVCLDEMNLAPVEQYFAEFLSILESRKDVDGTIKSEPLIPAAIFNKYDNKLFKELFPSKEKQEKGTSYTIDKDKIAPCSNATYEKLREEGLRIPRNLIVVGTVNMDDTTYRFSRKVIDRAMTIEMNEVNLNDMFDIEKPDALSYHEDVVDKGWFFAPFAQSNNALQQMNDKRELLVEKIKATIGQTDADGTTTPDSLEAILGKTPFRIAYRVVNELILHFYALRWEDKDADFEELYNKALDNILMMKVLPRIEGNEDLVKDPLAQLATWTEVAYPKANAKIIEMRERLERSHFTSFWP